MCVLPISELMTTLRNAGLDKLDHTLDPLMEIVSQYESEADLQQKIQHLFHSLISDPDSQVLSSQDFCTNIARKRFRGGSTVMIRFASICHTFAFIAWSFVQVPLCG